MLDNNLLVSSAVSELEPSIKHPDNVSVTSSRPDESSSGDVVDDDMVGSVIWLDVSSRLSGS